MTAAAIIFAVTYVAMAGAPLPLVRVDRPAAALCGAVAMVIAGALSLKGAYAAIDLPVITLLLGVMIIAAYLQEAGFFRYVAYLVLTRARTARSLVWMLVLAAGALSAVLMNDTVCLMFTPLVVAVVSEAGLPVLPYLLALASASNIGSVISYTGNPQNVIIAQAAAGKLSYLQYVTTALPVGVSLLLLDAWLIGALFRRSLDAANLAERRLPPPDFDRRLAATALAALGLFVVLAAAGVALPGAAMAAAALLILAAGRSPREALARIDWSLLLFFAGLFVLVAGFERSGALEDLFRAAAPLVRRGGLTGSAAFVALAALGSNLVSSVPFVAVAVSWVPRLPDPAWGYMMLAFGSTLAGNLTIFGSVANIIVLDRSGKREEIGFVRFLRYGAVITACTLVAAFALLALVRALR